MRLILIFLLTLFCLFVPLSTVKAEEEILLSDNFNDGNLDGWVIENGNWFVSNGNLAGSKSGKNFGGRINGGDSEWENYILETGFNVSQGIDMGVGFRYLSGVSGYELNFRAGTGIFDTPQIILRKAQDGVVSVVKDTHSFPLINNKWYHLKLEVNGENIKVWVDNTLIFDIKDTETKVRKGGITFSYWTGVLGIIFTRFDNIVVTSLASPIPLKTPLILIPGIGGSELKVNEDTIWLKDDGHGGEYNHAYSKDEKVWVNESEAAKPGDDDYFDVLRMKNDGLNSEADLGITGSLYAGAYQQTVNFFTDNGYTLNQDLFIFPYDWRKDISLTADLLDEKISQIKSQTGTEKVDILSHSMGGLVARNYIADTTRASKVRKLVELGVPHLGAVDFLKGLLYGVCLKYPVGPYCLSLAPSEVKDVLQNMVSGYELSPTQKYFSFYSGNDASHPVPFRDDRDIDNNGVAGALNYFQIKDLLSNLGHNTSLFIPAESFHSLDNSSTNTNGVDVTVISGSGISTLGQIIEKDKFDFGGIKITEKDELKINGDGTVPLYSASLNDSSLNLNDPSTKIYFSNQKHESLPGSGSALNLVKNILNNDSTIPAGISTTPYKLNGTLFSVHSPVNIHVYDSQGNHTGPTSEGNFEANIPGSSYDSLDDAKFIFLPEDGVYTIRFEATDQGSFDFKIRKFEDDLNSQTLLYKNIPITSSSAGETNFDTNSTQPPTLIVDQQPITPNAILLGDANYDLTPPKILANSPVNGQIYLLNQNVQIDYSCTDEVSGLDSCIGSAPNGSNLDTSSLGIKTFNIYASDKAGNTSFQTITYKVQYLNSGLCNNEPGHAILQPIDTDGSSVFKLGSTVPAKFRVCDSNGISIGLDNVVSDFKLVQTTSGTNVSSINEQVSSTNPDSSFRWDPTNKLWLFNMSTKTLSSGKTYSYKVSLNDSSSIDFSFGLK